MLSLSKIDEFFKYVCLFTMQNVEGIYREIYYFSKKNFHSKNISHIIILKCIQLILSRFYL